MSQTGLHNVEGVRQDARLRDLFHAHTSPAFHRLAAQAAGTTVSLATCEKVPTSGDSEGTAANTTEPKSALSPPQQPELGPAAQDAAKSAVAANVGDAPPEKLCEAARRGVDAVEALHASLGRSDERQERVVALLDAGEVSQAKRLAKCQKQSVQLRCPDGIAQGCGSKENYVPISCDSRLCPDCAGRRQGRAAERFGDVIRSWSNPTMIRLSLPNRVDPTAEELERAVDALRGAFGRLRRRVIPAEGRHRSMNGELRRWVWASDGGVPADHYWKSALLASDEHATARRWQKKYVEQDRGIPADEVFRGGFYGIDAKQGDDGTVNVHLHALVDIPYVPQAALASVWDDLVGAPVVDVRRVEQDGTDAEIEALMEVVGYATKPPEYQTPEAAAAYASALKGAKLVQPFGNLHGNVEQPEPDLTCADCGKTPLWWNYEGTVDSCVSTMGATWSDPTRGENDPPCG